MELSYRCVREASNIKYVWSNRLDNALQTKMHKNVSKIE